MQAKIKNKIRIAAIGDLHVRMQNNIFREIFEEISRNADVLVLCGDLTDHGDPKEAEVLIEELESCKIPVVAVLGNHDYDRGLQEEITTILKRGRVSILQNEPCEINGVGFAGVKGFAGGFDKYMLSPFGEELIKKFVFESVNEAMQLEKQLADLKSAKKIVVLHYSPIKETVKGEPEEIMPFIGSSRLAEPIDHFGASLVLHGHAHRGSPTGKTLRGIPVYNVSLPVMMRINPQQPYFLGEI